MVGGGRYPPKLRAPICLSRVVGIRYSLTLAVTRSRHALTLYIPSSHTIHSLVRALSPSVCVCVSALPLGRQAPAIVLRALEALPGALYRACCLPYPPCCCHPTPGCIRSSSPTLLLSATSLPVGRSLASTSDSTTIQDNQNTLIFCWTRGDRRLQQHKRILASPAG